MTKSVDEIIADAILRGEFNDLKNKGKPLDLNNYFDTPDDLRMAYSVLKNADIIPEEVQMLKEIGELQEKVENTADETELKTLKSEIEKRRLRYNLLMDRHRKH